MDSSKEQRVDLLNLYILMKGVIEILSSVIKLGSLEME